MAKRFQAHRPKPARIAGGPDPRPVQADPTPGGGIKGRARRRPPGPERRVPAPPNSPPKEIGGPSGPEPTRYGDWERKGICVDF